MKINTQDIIYKYKGCPDITYIYMSHENDFNNLDRIRLYYKDCLDKKYDLIMDFVIAPDTSHHHVLRFLDMATDSFIKDDRYIKRSRYIQFHKEMKELIND